MRRNTSNAHIWYKNSENNPAFKNQNERSNNPIKMGMIVENAFFQREYQISQ